MGDLVLKGATSGQITLTPTGVAGTNTLTLPAKTGNLITSADSGTVTPTMLTQPLTAGTAQASTSGTSITFTGIPSWVKRITVMFNGVSTNGSSVMLTRIGSGSVTTSGYTSSCCYISSTPGLTSSSAGYAVTTALDAASTMSGNVVIDNVSSNVWVYSSILARTNDNVMFIGGGTISLSGTLDRVSVTTANGTDTFDAGSINILYE